MNGGRIPREGHAKPVRDSRLTSPAFAAKTGGAPRSFQRNGESRPGLGLRRSARPRPARYDRTGRNVAHGDTAPLRRAGLVNHCRTPARLNALLNRTTDYLEASDFDFNQVMYDVQRSCYCRIAGPITRRLPLLRGVLRMS